LFPGYGKMIDSLNINFVEKYLQNVTWHVNKNYQVEGLLKKSNQYYKFDIRYLSDYPNNKKGKLINSKSYADKVLFEDKKNWILVDTEELKKYMIENKLKEVKLEDLLSKLEWNIILPK